MTPPELLRMPATELTAAIRDKELSPVELTEAVLAQIEEVNPIINAFLDFDADRALESARAAEGAVLKGEELGPLHGLPVPIKDLEPSAGLRYTSGSILQKEQIADFDGAVTGRVKAAGGVIIGKTNTPHLGHKDMCDNLLGEPGRNPWNTDRTPGGSSGGAAAAFRQPCAVSSASNHLSAASRIGPISTFGRRVPTMGQSREPWPTRPSLPKPQPDPTPAIRLQSPVRLTTTFLRSPILSRLCGGCA